MSKKTSRFIQGLRSNSKEFTLFAVLVVTVVVLSLLTEGKFTSSANIQSMAAQLPEFGFFALGMMIVILTGGINLSVVNTAAMSSIVGAMTIAKLYSAGEGSPVVSIVVGIALVVAVALAGGLLNGYTVSYVGVTPMLVTLATMMIFEGVGLLLSKGNAISGFPKSFMWIGSGKILGVPFPMILFIIAVIAYVVLLEHTPWGKRVYMVGCNPTATLFSGINNKKVLMKVYLLSAACGALAAVIIMSRYNSAKVDYGSSYMMKSVTAAVLGGANINGGYGRVMGTVIAVLIIQSISSGLNLLNVNRFLSDVVMGLLLLSVLTINFVSATVKDARKKRQTAVKISA